MHRVIALAVPSVVAFDLSVVAQVFGRQPGRYSFDVCAPARGPVPTSTGFDLVATSGLEALDRADTVVVPGYQPVGARPDEAVLDALRAAAARGARMASVCVGAFGLAEAGLLDGRAATTHWAHAEEFRRRFPAVRLDPDVLYVDDGPVLTSAGMSSGIDLCLHMVRQDHGESVAADVARHLVVATHRTGGQTQYARRPVPPDGGLGPTREWAVAELRRPLTVGHLARHAGLPVRTFTRQFVRETDRSPMRWLTEQRVAEARRLLEATSLPVESVAELSGFGSAATLRAQLARALGQSPTTYRRAHRAAGA